VQPLAGILVVDLSRYLPGAYASRELLRLGARVVRVEPPEGDPLRRTAPSWDRMLRTGTESVVCDLKHDPGLARALCRRADVVLASDELSGHITGELVTVAGGMEGRTIHPG